MLKCLKSKLKNINIMGEYPSVLIAEYLHSTIIVYFLKNCDLCGHVYHNLPCRAT